MKSLAMRDAFFDRLYEMAKRDRNIIIVNADTGAPSLDKFRKNLSSQFINVGVAEANMVIVAAGLALSGKKVFTYSIMPFATLRCYEMIKVDLCLMNLPVTVIGIGAGFSYDDLGPTHHSTEDIAIMRVLPNMTILNSSDSVMAEKFAEMACKLVGPSYIRLDRQILPQIYNRTHNFSRGLNVLKEGEMYIISTGNMVHIAMEVSAKLAEYSIEAGVIDLFRLKPVNEKSLLEKIEKSKGIVTIEEHLINGGLGSIIAEILVDKEKNIPFKRFAIPDKYYYVYGGRKNIQTVCGLGVENIAEEILNWIK